MGSCRCARRWLVVSSVAALRVPPPCRPADIRFEHTVKASVLDVIAFYNRDDILEVLTPIPVRTERKEPIDEQSVNAFVLGGLVKWVARHSDVVRSPDALEFTDVQEEGPMKLWHHRHQIRGDESETTIVDTVWLDHSTFATRLFFSPPALYALFVFRAVVTTLYLRTL